jgi:regulator of sigma E protease
MASVEEVAPPAGTGLQVNDVVTAVKVKVPVGEPGFFGWLTGAGKEKEERLPVKDDQWGWAFLQVQALELKPEMTLEVQRNNTAVTVPLTAQPDPTWPLTERGLLLMSDTRLQKADGIGQAVWMGLDDTGSFILNIYATLRMLVFRPGQAKNLVGPLRIVSVAYQSAGLGFGELAWFLGLISINLAVINFLPIPFLDGGHMVFLIYEWVRGKPAPEAVQHWATLFGVAFLILLMAGVLIMDLLHLTGVL